MVGVENALVALGDEHLPLHLAAIGVVVAEQQVFELLGHGGALAFHRDAHSAQIGRHLRDAIRAGAEPPVAAGDEPDCAGLDLLHQFELRDRHRLVLTAVLDVLDFFQAIRLPVQQPRRDQRAGVLVPGLGQF